MIKIASHVLKEIIESLPKEPNEGSFRDCNREYIIPDSFYDVDIHSILFEYKPVKEVETKTFMARYYFHLKEWIFEFK